jgi:SAM-dependent methyltransferase
MNINTTTTKDFEWTPEAISDFWDDVSNEPRLNQLYFTKFNGRHISRLCSLVDTDAKILDYGSGPGYLTRNLLDDGFMTAALDFSPKSVQSLETQFKDRPNWLGGTHVSDPPCDLKSEEFDTVITCETYEHLLDEWIPGYFQEIRRLLRPGGHMILTTPCQEDLSLSFNICPKCHTHFHKWGHLRSVDPDVLRNEVQSAGFDVKFCQGINLRDLGNHTVDDTTTGKTDRVAYRGRRFQVLRSFARVLGLSDFESMFRPEFKKHEGHTFDDLFSLTPGEHLVLIATRNS